MGLNLKRSIVPAMLVAQRFNGPATVELAPRESHLNLTGRDLRRFMHASAFLPQHGRNHTMTLMAGTPTGISLKGERS